jgi:hypothetical protein
VATRFVSIDRNIPMLLPPDLRDWVPADHLAHFVIDAVEGIDLREVRVNTRGHWRQTVSADDVVELADLQLCDRHLRLPADRADDL